MAELPNPAPDWISERMWRDILTLPVLPSFAKMAEEFGTYLEEYKTVFDSPDPHKQPLPGHWNEDLDEFQKMLVLKCVRADKITNAMQVWYIAREGKSFVQRLPVVCFGKCFVQCFGRKMLCPKATHIIRQ